MNSSVDINVLTSDTDPDGDPILISSSSNGGHSKEVKVVALGVIRYAPSDNYIGPDSFIYTIIDQKGAPSIATVSVTVNIP